MSVLQAEEPKAVDPETEDTQMEDAAVAGKVKTESSVEAKSADDADSQSPADGTPDNVHLLQSVCVVMLSVLFSVCLSVNACFLDSALVHRECIVLRVVQPLMHCMI